MKSYHKSNLGMYGGHVQADMDGYVHLTAAAVLAGRWDTGSEGDMTEEEAEEIAEHNRKATAEAEAEIADWQNENT